MIVKARVYCETVTQCGAPATDKIGSINGSVASENLVFRAITSGGEDDPNKSYSKWTPNLELKMTVTNPQIFGQFVPGHLYDLTFAPTPPRTEAPYT